MMSRKAVVVTALLCLAFGAAAAAGFEEEAGDRFGDVAGRKLQAHKKKGYGYVDNSGTINARTSQSGTNIANGSKNVNQANSNQNAQAAGNGASASNSADISQENYGRKLQAHKKKGYGYVDNSGTINARTSQSGTNIANGSKNVNQANNNQNAQAAGNGASASNSADISQENYGRKLQAHKQKGYGYVDNSGTINARTSQSGTNIANGSKNINQANNNQNAQAAGYGASASNSADISQENYGRKLQAHKTKGYGYVDNSGTINARTSQSGTNIANGSKYVNQANNNQNAQAAGNGASASNSADISQENYGRKLHAYKKKYQGYADNSGTINAATYQSGSNVANGSKNVNQANNNQNAQAAGNGASASNSAYINQGTGR